MSAKLKIKIANIKIKGYHTHRVLIINDIGVSFTFVINIYILVAEHIRSIDLSPMIKI